MKPLISIAAAGVAAISLSACGEPSNKDAETAGTPSAGVDNRTIPAAAIGRWGLVAADCDPTRDDAKGLMTVGATTLEFYESRGTLNDVEERSATRIAASFDFSGEGMEWTRRMILDVQDGGATLVRREYGDDAAPGPFRYMACE